MMPFFGTISQFAFARKLHSLPEGFLQEAEGFLRSVLGLCMCKFPQVLHLQIFLRFIYVFQSFIFSRKCHSSAYRCHFLRMLAGHPGNFGVRCSTPLTCGHLLTYSIHLSSLFVLFISGRFILLFFVLSH